MSWYDRVKYTLYAMLIAGGYYALTSNSRPVQMATRQDPRALPQWRLGMIERAYASDDQIPNKLKISYDYPSSMVEFLKKRFPGEDKRRLVNQISLHPDELDTLLKGTWPEEEIIELQIDLYNHRANYFLKVINDYGSNTTKQWLKKEHYIDPAKKIQ